MFLPSFDILGDDVDSLRSRRGRSDCRKEPFADGETQITDADGRTPLATPSLSLSLSLSLHLPAALSKRTNKLIQEIPLVRSAILSNE